MINLMPPATKEQIRFAKMNRTALAYLKVVVLVVIALGGTFAGAYYLIDTQINSISADVASKESQIAAEKHAILPPAEDASQRLSAIEYVESTQTKFSVVISKLVKLMPVGVDLQTMTLTGSAKTPVSLHIASQTYDQVLGFRNSLAADTSFISAADIVSITCQSQSQSGPPCTADVVIGFLPGQAQ